MSRVPALIVLLSLFAGAHAIMYRYGGTEGNFFTDGESAGVVSLYIWHGRVVEGIQVLYDYGAGQYIWSPLHGSVGTKAGTRINLQYPWEQIIEMRGYSGPNPWTNNGINQLYLITYNTHDRLYRTYGPFGTIQGQYFQSPSGTVVGFAGYTSPKSYVPGIGVYLRRPCVSQNDDAPVFHQLEEPAEYPGFISTFKYPLELSDI